jgi:hypothetical protein
MRFDCSIDDGFQIYLHGFVLNAAGQWTIVQQGLDEGSGFARRYHWHSATVKDFTIEPHTAVVGEYQGQIMNLVAAPAAPAHRRFWKLRGLEPVRP